MRQAGRYLPEYRAVRGDGDILDTCLDPARVAEITVQPLRRMPLDAAILFSDIMVPLAAVGVPVRIEQGRGPVVDPPFRSRGDVERLRPLEPDADVPHVIDAIRLVRGDLDVPLLGFAGAPFTLASYLVEGGPSRDHARTKALMLGDPATWNTLMERLVDIVVPHLRAQIAAGADAVQVFDSWIGALSPHDYDRSVRPHVERVFAAIADLRAPAIHFGVGTGELLSRMRVDGVAAIGVDHRVPLDAAWDRVGHDLAIQGNLDPAALLAPADVVAAETRAVLARAAGRDGHVFNLGHGVLPSTPVGSLQRVVDLVHAETERTAVASAIATSTDEGTHA
jgi:uroporphyrinogen decarboxylase